jgi:hypothetical protein
MPRFDRFQESISGRVLLQLQRVEEAVGAGAAEEEDAAEAV